MAPEDYRTAFHSDPKFDMILGKSIQGENMTEDQEKELTTELLEQDRVLSATAIASISREFKTAMKNLDAVVMVIILFACLLNFIVLYNLININITERTREIATIKVLGFLPREVSAYMNREIFALTGIGILIGLVCGIFLHQFTIQNAEVDIVMYVREIQLASFAWSVLLTILFSLVINLAIRRRLRRIKMVESLKSVE
jgi:putative ABC transport system permease protein